MNTRSGQARGARPVPHLEVGRWYAAAELFGDPVRIGFGRQYRGQARFEGGTPLLETDWTELRRRPDYPYCAVTLEGIDPERVFRMPDPLRRAEQLLRQSCWRPSAAAFGYVVRLRRDGVIYEAEPEVVLDVTHLDPRSGNLLHRDRQRVVANAHREGLMNDAARSRANFRIYFKQLMAEFDAMLDSGYVPDHAWRASVVYGAWRREDGDWVLSPFGSTSIFRRRRGAFVFILGRSRGSTCKRPVCLNLGWREVTPWRNLGAGAARRFRVIEIQRVEQVRVLRTYEWLAGTLH